MKTTLAAVIVGAWLLLTACGNGAAPVPEGTPTGMTPSMSTPSIPPRSAPVPLPTISDPFGVPLVTREGSAADFTLSVPPEWNQVVVNGADQFDINVEGYTPGWLSVSCARPMVSDPNLEYDSLNVALEQTSARNTHRSLGTAGAIRAIEVNGMSGAWYDASSQLGFGISETTVIFAQPDCAWTVSFVLGGAVGEPEKYTSLFGRIIETFRPADRP